MGRERVAMILNGADATRQFAAELAPKLTANTVLALYGDLGAGKTTFLQGLVRGLGGSEEAVHSPTYLYLHLYPAFLTVHHFDLYRLRSSDDFLAMGFAECFESGGITAIEWPERIEMILPVKRIEIRFTTLSEESRKIEICVM